jgi:hypothetical protein
LFYYLFVVKRIFIVLLALVYFVAASGMLLRQHYCAGAFVATQIDFSSLGSTELCDDCGMEAEEGSCCESKTLMFKKTIEQQIIEFQSWDIPFSPFDLLPIFTIPVVPKPSATGLIALQAFPKPPPKSIPIFKEICCFKI